MSEKQEKKEKKAAGCFSEFIITLLACAVFIASGALICYGVFYGNRGFQLLGIGASAVFGLLVFIIPYFRRNSLIKWLAVGALADAAWWTYAMFTD